MAYRKKTLRSMLPVTRKVARLIGELESIDCRFKNLIPELQRIEMESRALQNAKQVLAKEAEKPAEQILAEAIQFDQEG